LRNFFTIQFFCICLSAALLFQGCALSLNHWKGVKKSELISTWGAPKKILPTRKGGNILVYDRSPWETDMNYLGNHTSPTRLIGFYVNKMEIVYDWKEFPLGKTLYK